MGGTRHRLLEAALTCVEATGLADVSLDDVARCAGMSRATVYRYFPGGRDQLVSTTVAYEVGRFLARLGEAIEHEEDLAGRLRVALLVGHRAIHEHQLLQRLLQTEPEVLLRELAGAEPVLLGGVRDHLRRELAAERLCPGVDLDRAADHLARMFLSYLGTHGRWDLGDPVEVERLVRTYLLAGVVAAPADDGPVGAASGPR